MAISTVEISSINFRSIKSVKVGTKELDLKREDYKAALDHVTTISKTRGYRLSRALIEDAKSFKDAKEVLKWGSRNTEDLKTVSKAFKNSGRGIWLIHSASLEKPAKRTEILKTYFDEGGSVKDAALWISKMGAIIKQAKNFQTKNYDYSLGDLIDDVGDAFEAAGGAIADGFEALADLGEDFVTGLTELVSGVLNDIINAGKSFLQVVGEIASFTYNELKDFVTAIVEIGRDIGEFLSAVATESYNLLKNAVKALIEVGKSIGEIISVALTEGFDLLKKALRALLDIGKTIGKVLKEALQASYNILKSVVKGLIEIGRAVSSILQEALSIAYNLLKKTLKALFELGKNFGEILLTLVTKPNELFEKVLKAIKELGNSLAEIMAWTVGQGLSFIKKVGRSLIKIGESITNVITTVLEEGMEVVQAVVEGILDAGKTALDLMKTFLNKAQSVFTTVYQAMVNIGKNAFKLLEDALDYSFTLLKKATKAFFEIGKTVGEFMVNALKNTYALSATFIKAALEAGKSVVDILTTAAEKSYWLIRETVNGILDAVGLGKIGEVLDWAFSVSDAVLKKAIKAIRYVTKKATDVLGWAVDKGAEALDKVIGILKSISTRAREILNWALEKGHAIMMDIAAALRRVGQTASYILFWASEKGFEILGDVIEGLKSAVDGIGEIMNWALNRSYNFLKATIEKLVSLGSTLTELIITSITEPNTIFKNVVKAFLEIGKTVYEIFVSIKDEVIAVAEKVWWAIKALGWTVVQLLDWAASQSRDVLEFIVKQLIDLGVALVEIVVWAISQAVDIAFFVLDIVDAVLEIWDEIVEAVLDLAGDKIGRFFQWIINKAGDAASWLIDKVVQPLMGAAKVGIVIAIIVSAVAGGFGLIVLLVLAALFAAVKIAPTTYEKWPDTIEAYKQYLGGKLLTLDEPTDNNKYVIFSDIHRDTQSDVEGNIGHFYKNKALFKAVLDKYGTDNEVNWTMIENGDCDELWYNTYLTMEHSPISKIEDIMSEHSDLHNKIKTLFHDHGRYVRLRGNHDDYWTNPMAIDRLRQQFPGISIYEAALISHSEFKNFLVMHGHQFDDVNCDEHNWFGKLVVELVASSLDAIEFENWDSWIDDFGLDIDPVTLTIAPFYEEDEWEEELVKVKKGELDSGIMFDESRIIPFARDLDLSIIFGHTHTPKVAHDPDNSDRLYLNSGNVGWWEHVVWALEIHHDKVELIPWVFDEDGNVVKYDNKSYTDLDAAPWYVA